MADYKIPKTIKQMEKLRDEVSRQLIEADVDFDMIGAESEDEIPLKGKGLPIIKERVRFTGQFIAAKEGYDDRFFIICNCGCNKVVEKNIYEEDDEYYDED